MKNLSLLALTAFFTAACSGTYVEEPCEGASCAAPPPAEASPAPPASAANEDGAIATTLAAARAGASSATVVADVADAVDFDLEGADRIVLLRRSPSRIDACTGGTCRPHVRGSSMPKERATPATGETAAVYENASLAFVRETGALIVAQSGTGKCFEDCTSHTLSEAAIYAVGAGAAPTWLAQAVPLTYAKAFRATNGWLVGDTGYGWALEQRANNEYVTVESTLVVAPLPRGALATTSHGRGSQGPMGRRPSPFAFLATTTPSGSVGWVGEAGAFGDATSSEYVDAAPLSAAIPTTSPLAQNVWYVAAEQPAGRVSTFANGIAPSPGTRPFDGIDAASKLVATARDVAYWKDGPNLAFHVCAASALADGTCNPRILATPFSKVIRTRAQGDSLLVLGEAGGTRSILRVTFR